MCHIIIKQATKNALVKNSLPIAVAVGHMNNDTHLDIAVASSGTNRISLFLGYGNGSFAVPIMYSTGDHSRPRSIAIADINADDRMDIIVANYDSHSMAVLLGQHDGIFTDPIDTFLGPSRPVSIAIGDLNNDTWLDVVVTNNGTHSISVLIGNGQGSFEVQMTYSTGYDSFPYGIAIADLNNDHRVDVAVANYGTNNICIFLGQGNGMLVLHDSFSTGVGSNPHAITLADLNNDEQLDIVVANYHGHNIAIFFGYGNGTFSIPKTYFLGVGFHPYSIDVGYIDHDRQLDIVVSNIGADSVSLLIGYENGTFAVPATYPIPSGSSPSELTVGDFDNNNQSDVVLANFEANNIIIFLGYTSISSKNPTVYALDQNSHPYHLVIADLNKDNKTDIIVPNDATDSIGMLYGHGDGSFEEQIPFSTGRGTGPNHLAIADFNNDSFLDIVVANNFADSISLFLGHANGNFTTFRAFSFGQVLSIKSVAAGDFDGDQNIDIVLTDFGYNRILVFLGYGNGSFDLVQSYTTGDGSRPIFVAVADFNNDQYLDIATANYGTNKVGIFVGYGNGSFTNQTAFSSTDALLPTCIAVEDINNDRCLDIVVANSGSNNVGLLLGHCNGTFAAHMVSSTNSQSAPFSVTIGDVNDDQWLDVVVANADLDHIGIFFGYGNGNFATQITFSTGLTSVPCFAAIVDLNNDHRLDVAVVNRGTSKVAILLGHANTGINNTAEYLLGDYYSDFLIRTYYSTGSSSHPSSIAVGDLNNDTYLDAVVANSGTDTIGILLGDGSGLFLEETTYLLDSNSRPRSVIVVDFNKDDLLDIAVANFLADNIVIFQGHGNGSFAQQSVVGIPAESNPSSLASGDFNNDGWLDLVVTNTGGNSIDLLFGFRYTSFQRPVKSTAVINAGITFLTVGDFNTDGRLDVIIANFNTNNVGILLGLGNGSFTAPTTYANIDGSHPWCVAVADFNNDSRLDIAIAVWGLDQIGVILGNGDGTFGEPILSFIGLGTRPVSIITGDFNNDHHADIATANYGAGSVSVFLGLGNGTFSEARTFSTGAGSSPRSVTIADLDKDHLADIIVSNADSHSVGIFYGNGDGTFENVALHLVRPNSIPRHALSGDFNNDTLPDIAVAMYGSSEIGIFLGYGNRTFSSPQFYSGGFHSGPHCLQFDDLNDDRYIDIVIANLDASNVGILFGNGDGTFKDIVLYDMGADTASYSLALADCNNDDVVDVIFADYTKNEIVVIFRNGYQSFGGYTSLPYLNNSKPTSVAVGHLNNDNNLDIVIANSGNDNVGILHGHGDGTFTEAVMYSIGKDASQPSSIALDDFNSDTFLDIIVANSYSDTVSLLLGSSDGSFYNVTTFSTGRVSKPVSIIAGDFNYDGILDIVAANAGTNNVALLIGNGNGSFAHPIFYSMDYDSRPNWVIFGNFNNDSWVDIAVVNYGADNIKLLLNCPSN